MDKGEVGQTCYAFSLKKTHPPLVVLLAVELLLQAPKTMTTTQSLLLLLLQQQQQQQTPSQLSWPRPAALPHRMTTATH